jgi:nicotinamidase-related amidase
MRGGRASGGHNARMESTYFDRLTPATTQILVVDIQERLLPHIDGHERIVTQTSRLLRGAALFGLPVLISEQYIRGLGPTVPAIVAAAGAAPRLEKSTFSAFADPAIQSRLEQNGRPNVLIAGIETHVCVLQTALDLLRDGMEPWILADAVGSRRTLDRDVAIERLSLAGAIVATVESVLFEMMHRCDAPEFRALLDIVK